jgi:hypothetical protein
VAFYCKQCAHEIPLVDRIPPWCPKCGVDLKAEQLGTLSQQPPLDEVAPPHGAGKAWSPGPALTDEMLVRHLMAGQTAQDEENRQRRRRRRGMFILLLVVGLLVAAIVVPMFALSSFAGP